MSFILKPNNRKIRSGSTIQAKIVSPDKKDFAIKNYSVLVQTQSLSAYDRVIRDAQQIGAILDAANDWANITDAIEDLSIAMQANSNGSTILSPVWTNSSISDGEGHTITYVTSGGTIANRPVYDPSNASPGHTAKLTIPVVYEDARASVEREFVIPAYTADEVLAVIRSRFDTTDFWNAIKGDNIDRQYIYKNLVDPTENVIETILNNYGIADIINTEVTTAVPALTLSYPNYYTSALVSNKTTYNRISATDMYQLDAETYSVTALRDSSVASVIADIDSTHLKNNTVAYRLASKNDADNKVTATWTLGNATSVIKTIDVGFVSTLIKNSQIRNNIEESEHIGWFLPAAVFGVSGEYGIEDVACKATSTSERFEITIPAGKNVVIKLPKDLTDLLSVPATDQILDASNIGYSVNEQGEVKGFSDSLFSFMLTLNTDAYASTVPVDYTDSLSPSGDPLRAFNSANYDQRAYIYVPKESFTGDIDGQLSFIPNQNSLPTDGDTPTNITIFFTLKKGS